MLEWSNCLSDCTLYFTIYFLIQNRTYVRKGGKNMSNTMTLKGFTEYMKESLAEIEFGEE